MLSHSGMALRLAAIDLDGTLLNSAHEIPGRNSIAIRRLDAMGVHCILASGRMHESTLRYAEELQLTGPIISYNGAMVRTTAGETWLHQPLPPEPAATVTQFCSDHGYHLNFYYENRVHVAAIGTWARFYLEQTGSPMEAHGSLLSFIGKAPTKLLLIAEPDTIHKLQPRFRELFGDSVYITTTNPEYLEFMHPEASKGKALQYVAERLHIDQNQTVAFGDALNDISMLAWAGVGVAMMSGNPAVIAAADCVAPSADDAGLAQWLEARITETDG